VPTSANDSETDIVLKGVVRVEALPQPSEHIAVLLQRVKPVYLSRTYGLQLPSSKGDVAPVGEVEEFLERLARIKGRLLKGGEPDIEGVAKIVLNDWVRGKIPYFVPPPDRPKQDSGRSVEKELTKVKDWEKGLKPVPQRLASIIQKNKFEDEDIATDEESPGDLEIQSDEHYDSEVDVSEEEPEMDLGKEIPATGDQNGSTDPELGWEEVLGAVIGPTGKPRTEETASVVVVRASAVTSKGKRKGACPHLTRIMLTFSSRLAQSSKWTIPRMSTLARNKSKENE
jgi:nuclear GTP-binding protein